MKFSEESIGARIIQAITEGLYDGNLNCIREYIQNGVDAGAKNISVVFENEKTLVIEDDGNGMDKEELINALSIGKSSKNESNIGWRGIGIWSGVAVSKKLQIITKKRNSPKFLISIDCDNLRNIYLGDFSAIEVLSQTTSEISELDLSNDESYEESHYTIIRLESILRTLINVYNNQKIKDYLIETVPASINESKFSNAHKINEWLKNNQVTIPDVSITYNKEKIFRPPTDESLFFKDAIICRKFYYPQDNETGELLAVAWFISSKDSVALPKPNGGIYFRKKGFTIGDRDFVKNLANGSYHFWQYGEIHIVSSQIKENTARNNFEYNYPHIEDFLNQIGQFILKLENINRYNSTKNQYKKAIKLKSDYEKGLIDSDKYDSEKRKIIRKMDSTRHFPEGLNAEALKNKIDGNQQKAQDLLLDQNIHRQETITSSSSDEKQSGHDVGKKEEADIREEKEGNNGVFSPNEEPETYLSDIEYIRLLRSTINPETRASFQRFNKKSQREWAISITDILKAELQKRTNLTEDSMNELSKAAFGWKKIENSEKPPILILDPENIGKKNHNPPSNTYRNQRLGLAIYTCEDMVRNLYIHEQGQQSFKWYESLTLKEKERITVQVQATIDLLLHILSHTQKYEDIQ